MGNHEEKLVKVVFTVEDGDDVEVETPWAKQVGPNEYELDNLPWYAYGISCGDVFEAFPTDYDPRPHLKRVLRKSGNRTLRLILKPPANESAESMAVLTRVAELGCSYEGMDHSLIAINVPAEVDFAAVCAFLTETGHNWEHADPTYDDLYPGEPDDSARRRLTGRQQRLAPLRPGAAAEPHRPSDGHLVDARAGRRRALEWSRITSAGTSPPRGGGADRRRRRRSGPGPGPPGRRRGRPGPAADPPG